MSSYTLNEHIKEQYKKSKTFAKYYDRELLINSIAKLALELRKHKHFTQQELAKKAGTTQSVIARLESGKDTRIPSLGLLLRIAAASGEQLNISFGRRSSK